MKSNFLILNETLNDEEKSRQMESGMLTHSSSTPGSQALSNLFVKQTNLMEPVLFQADVLLLYTSESLLVNARDGNLENVREILANSILHDLNRMPVSANYTTIMPSKKHKIDLEYKDHVEQTALNVAARFDFHEICLLLCEYGAQVNVKDKDGWTPLLNASRNGNLALAELFLSRRARCEEKDSGGFSPLMWACYKNQLQLVRLLLRHGADPNTRCKNSLSCLSWASGRGNEQIVQELLNCPNIKVNTQDQVRAVFLI
jgi:ankyrin repeat protein